MKVKEVILRKLKLFVLDQDGESNMGNIIQQKGNTMNVKTEHYIKRIVNAI